MAEETQETLRLEAAFRAAIKAGDKDAAAQFGAALREARNAPPQAPEAEGKGSLAGAFAQGATMEFGDEIQGVGGMFAKYYNDLSNLAENNLGISLPGAQGNLEASGVTFDDKALGAGDIYEGVRDEARAENEAYAAENPKTALAANIGGAMLTGGYGGYKMLASNAGKEIGKKGAVPLIAAIEGGLTGAGTGEGLEDTIKKGTKMAATSAVMAPLMNKAVNTVAKRYFKYGSKMGMPFTDKNRGAAYRNQQIHSPSKTLEDLKLESKSFYKLADESGVKVKPDAWNAFRRQVNDYARNRFGGIAKNQKSLKPFIDEMNKIKSPTYKQMDGLKQLLEIPKVGSNKARGDVAHKMDNFLDTFIDDLTPEKVLRGKGAVKDLGENINQAKGIWHRKAQAEALDEMQYKAMLSEDVVTNDDLDAAIRKGARQLLLGKTARRGGLDPEVKEGLERLITGGKGQQARRFIAEMAPGARTRRGILPTMGSAGAGYAIGGPAGAGLAATIPAIGGGTARKLANVASNIELAALKDAIINKGQATVDDMVMELLKKYGAQIGGQTAAITASGVNAGLEKAETSLTDLINEIKQTTTRF